MRKIDLPIAPLVLGLILGPFIEKSLRTSLEMSGGDFSIFYTRPLCLGLLVVSALILVASALRLAPAEVREASKN
jgi:putative tricarboxylic transport membrane protein